MFDYNFMSNLTKVSNAKTRSISAENKDGSKNGGARSIDGVFKSATEGTGLDWKISPCLKMEPKSAETIVNISDMGVIQHIWMTTHSDNWRKVILRMYWDGEEYPSVEVPIGDFFCNGWCEPSNVNSIPITVNPNGGFNSFWQMPFRKGAKITVENMTDETIMFFYQVTYSITEVPNDAAYFHMQFRRSNPVEKNKEHVIVDDIKGKGHYVGTYFAWQVNSNRWWGEGEIKFFLDGDEFPTICGTGTEDYILGAWNFEYPKGEYGVFTNNYSGLNQVIKPDGLYNANQRFGMYRWHITDPIRFEENLTVTIQPLGWRPGFKRYLHLQDDISTIAVWYQIEPHNTFPTLPNVDELEIV